MELRFKGIHYSIPQKIADRATKKLQSLQKYIAADSGLVSAYVELGRETDAHQAGRVWQALVNLNCDGQVYRAEALEDRIEKAIDRVGGELAKELRRARTRDMTLMRRGGSFLKAFSRGFQS
jgi:ribosomal subunit interface protein